MKKIISALIICAMLFATLLAVVPASAATPREDLAAAIAKAEALDGTIYSKDSWDNLQNNLKTAKEAYDNENTSDLILNMNIGTLNAAINALKFDTTEMDELIKYVDQLEKDSNNAVRLGYTQGDFTSDTLAALKAAVDAAKAAKVTNTVDAIATATADLKAAVEGIKFNPIPADMAAKLAQYLELADILIPEDWSDSAWGMVELKVQQAADCADDQRISTQHKVVTELETALKNLTPDKSLPTPPVLDYSYLDEIINYIDTSFSADMFTEDSWAVLKAAYDNAKTVRETTKKQVELKAAYDKLNNARKALVLAPKAEVTDAPTEAPTDAPADTTEPAGCGGFVATSVVVVAAVSVLGTAVVLKKKED